MWPSRGVSGLQKTYDETYLKCSTAVYYEGQGDEREAMQCWKQALDQIRQNPATRRQSTYEPRSETERALLDSISQLKVQCKERIDLLEALRVSREDDSTLQSLRQSTTSDPLAYGDSMISGTSTPERGWIGDGTIPAIRYTELSKPPLPARPSNFTRNSENGASAGSPSGYRSNLTTTASSSAAGQAAPLPPYGSSTYRKTATDRSPSPDKYTMRTTLRSGSADKARTSKSSSSRLTKGPGASKAASLAWTGASSKDTTTSRTSSETSSRQPPRAPEPRRSLDQTRTKPAASHTYWDSHRRRLVVTPDPDSVGLNGSRSTHDISSASRVQGDNGPPQQPSNLALGAASSAVSALSLQDKNETTPSKSRKRASLNGRVQATSQNRSDSPASRSGSKESYTRKLMADATAAEPNSARKRVSPSKSDPAGNDNADSAKDDESLSDAQSRKRKGKQREAPEARDPDEEQLSDDEETAAEKKKKSEWEKKKKSIMKNLPPGVDNTAAQAIFNEIVVQGDEVFWGDVAGLEVAKGALREAVVYPFLRPDLFMGLREPARGMLLFGPPGTGKTMLARAVATESKSTFFSISASSLTSKWLGESEKLVRALFSLAKVMAPSIIFVDEIDSLLSQRSGSGEHESTRRIKTEFLIQWSDLQRAAAGRESPNGTKEKGDPNRVLVLAATNLPWAIDEAARRRFVRRQYIPLPEDETRATQLSHLLGQQKHGLTDTDIAELVALTDGFSGSDITALAKDAAMGPLRSLGEALLHMTMDEIRPIELDDFKASLKTIRPSVSKEGLKQYEDWAAQFGERGG